jgi:hypothetical protein
MYPTSATLNSNKEGTSPEIPIVILLERGIAFVKFKRYLDDNTQVTA